MATILSEKVDGWLKEMGHAPSAIEDPGALWHVQFQYPLRSPNMAHVVVPQNQSDAAVIAMGINLGPQHRAAFENLDDEGREAFNWELRQRLNNIDVEFKVDGVTTGRECPSSFQVLRTRYLDGLTKDGFAFSIGAVYKTWLKGLWYIQKELGSSSQGPGGRFDFRRFGV
jgi:hypothetical protein